MEFDSEILMNSTSEGETTEGGTADEEGEGGIMQSIVAVHGATFGIRINYKSNISWRVHQLMHPLLLYPHRISEDIEKQSMEC